MFRNDYLVASVQDNCIIDNLLLLIVLGYDETVYSKMCRIHFG